MYLLLAKGIALLAVVLALAFAWHRFTEHYRDQGRAEIQIQWDADRAARIKRTTELVLELSGKLQEAKDAQAKSERNLAAAFAVVNADVGAVRSTIGGIRLPADVRRVLDRAADAANADDRAADARGKAGAETVSAGPEAAAGVYDERELAAYFAGGAEAYADAHLLWRACRTREDACRAALNKGANP